MPLLARVLATLPGDVAPFFQGLAEGDPIPMPKLKADVREYARALQEAAVADPEIDAELGLELAGACRALLDRLGTPVDDEVHRVVSAAVMYFLLEDDADPDMAGFLGLDDDAEVVNVVAEILGHPDLQVALS